MAKYYGINFLRDQLNKKRERVKLRYEYYDMKHLVNTFGPNTPPELRNLIRVSGWCGTAVDSLADRIVMREFENDNFDLMGIYNLNSPDIIFDDAVLSAIISSCSFIYISRDSNGSPRLEVIDGGEATGIMDNVTRMLKEGYAVLERDDNDNPTIEAYFIPGETHIYYVNENTHKVFKHKAPYPLLVPVTYRPDAQRPFGRSHISRACMDYQNGVVRTIARSEISAEFYSYPQKYVLGLHEDASLDKFKAGMSMLLAISKDEDGDKPTVGQFTQQSMSPYMDQVKMFASLFAAETGLTVDDLGFVSDNPSSSDAIKASHEQLRLKARKGQRSLGVGFLNAGFLAACIRDDYAYSREALYLTKPLWEPIFEPDASMLSTIGDGAIKINNAVPGYFNTDNLRNITGIAPSNLEAIQPTE